MASLRWSGRLVALQCAVLLVVLGAVHSGPGGALVAAPPAAAIVLGAFGRRHGRWLSAWLGDALRYGTRPRGPREPVDPAALLRFARPSAVLADLPVTVEDAEGLVAVLDLDDPAGLLADAGPRLPAPTRLVPLAEPHPPDVRVTVQVLVSVVQPGGPGLASASYRQLTEGGVPARQRALLAVRLSRVDGGWPGEELRGALSGTVRRLTRRLARDGYPCRQLDADGARAALAELAPLESAGGTVREAWSGLDVGGWRQTCLRATGAHRLPDGALGRLVPRLLSAPGVGLATVALSASDGAAELVVRLAGWSPDRLALAVAEARQQAATTGLDLRRMDGGQAGGLAATLPLALPPLALRPLGTGRAGDGGAGDDADVALSPAGLVLGRNRQGLPLAARLFDAAPTRAVLLGGVRAAQALTLRALALGAQVAVQTARPYAWEPFLRAVSLPADAIVLLPPGPVGLPPARPSAPQLVVVDVGPVASAQPVPAAGWRTSLVLRDEVAAEDADLLVRADLVILQPLSGDEAEVVGSALGLGDGREWLRRIPAGMIGAVSRPGTGRAALRWALLSPTDLERQLIGSTERVAIG